MVEGFGAGFGGRSTVGESEIRGHGPRYLVAVVDQRYRGPSVERAAGMADSE